MYSRGQRRANELKKLMCGPSLSQGCIRGVREERMN
jgi:hypothetical protein